MLDISEFRVDKGTVAIWWLGQNGNILKTPDGTLLSTDMYLSNNCADVYRDAGVDLSRRVPVLIPPEELNVDIYICTHNHLDHTDPVTIGGLRNKDTAQFVGPHPVCEVYRQQGVEAGRLVPAWPACETELL